jgi:hypothetical protein
LNSKAWQIQSPLKFFLGGCAMALGVGFAKEFDKIIYFPFFPNILDASRLSCFHACMC